jgi:hypothetical protein
MTVHFSLDSIPTFTGRAVCDRCQHSMPYAGVIKTAGKSIPWFTGEGRNPIGLPCPWCGEGTMRYQPLPSGGA